MAAILIIEDEQPIRQILKQFLTPKHQTMEARNATEGIELARLTQPDLILLDLNLGHHHDGLEVCRALRSDPDPALVQAPIVMLTGRTSQVDIKAALGAGANSYVSKPYNPHSLLMLIDNLLIGKDITPAD